MVAVVLLALLTGCVVSRVPTAAQSMPQPAAPSPQDDWVRFLRTPGPLQHSAHTSATWAVPLKGLVDLTDPAAAGLRQGDVPIVLPVHVLTHSDGGTWLVDSGIDTDLAEGGHGGVRGLVRGFTGSIEPVAPLAEIVGERTVAGVLLTHSHLDHVLGLPDLALDVPVVMGPGELDARAGQNMLLGRTMASILGRRTAVRTLDLTDAAPLGPVPKAWDILGDGSLWALASPGHTPGSIAVLARTTEGPVLFTGDTCHTVWGWEHGVAPGTYTADADLNERSLHALKSLQQAIPELRVFVGHELDGVGTGVDDMP